MIELRDVTVVYPNGVEALTEVTTTIEKGEFLFLVGPTGHGKSTFLKLIYREHLPTKGQVLVAGRDVSRLPGRAIPYLRRRIGVVFQDFRLLPEKTVWENVAFALQVIGTPTREMHQRIPEILSQVGLEHKADAFPSQLSGGEEQRASIARALVNYPPILLADEPTGNLDPETSWDTIQLLSDINVRGTTVVVATHDQMVVDGMKKRVITLNQGRLISDEPRGGYHHAP